MTDTAPEPEVRTCAKCDQTDTDPHHVQYVAFAHPVTGAGVDLTVSKHVDCCAEDGCPICSTDIRYKSEAGSASMREFLTNRPKEEYQYLFEQFGIESQDYQIPPMPEET